MTPEQFASALISTATDFVGMVETRQNRVWDDPRTQDIETEKSVRLSRSMSEFGWNSGEPYCAAFAGAVVAITAARCGLFYAEFRRIWTPHCMTNVRKLKHLGLLDAQPSPGSLMLMRHGETDSGHAGLCCHIEGLYPNRMLITIEGNTMPGSAGDQRQGDGIYQRVRNVFTNGDLKTQGWLSAKSLLSLLSA